VLEVRNFRERIGQGLARIGKITEAATTHDHDRRHAAPKNLTCHLHFPEEPDPQHHLVALASTLLMNRSSDS
jgi:hypothetical protein